MPSGSKSRTPIAADIANAIRKVPRGRVSTYGAIAQAAGYPRCARYVARVLRELPGLPWQRIVGSGGRISLPREAGLEQRFLLEAEGVKFKGRRVDLSTFEHRFARSAVNAVKKKPSNRRVRRSATLASKKL